MNAAQSQLSLGRCGSNHPCSGGEGLFYLAKNADRTHQKNQAGQYSLGATLTKPIKKCSLFLESVIVQRHRTPLNETSRHCALFLNFCNSFGAKVDAIRVVCDILMKFGKRRYSRLLLLQTYYYSSMNFKKTRIFIENFHKY